MIVAVHLSKRGKGIDLDMWSLHTRTRSYDNGSQSTYVFYFLHCGKIYAYYTVIVISLKQ